tara:strand:+ start:141 stop:1535 length:1395 start_codon:yes stop_codon:yes gene_type:complete
MASQYLYDDIESFFVSLMWSGDKAYAQTPTKPWFGWIYISEFNGFDLEDYTEPEPDKIPILKFKIGYTLNLAQRTEGLSASTKTEKAIQDSSTIVYAWSVPRPKTFETKVLRFLKAFIHTDALLEITTGKTEIVHGLTLDPLVTVIQLCILEQCLEHGYIKGDNSVLKNQVMGYMRSPPDIIKDKDIKYYGKKLSKNVSYTMDMAKIVKIVKVQTYPHNYMVMKPRPTFAQYVFDLQPDQDKRKDNSKLKDATNITSASILTQPKDSGIDYPFHVGACVFTKYKDTYSPCRIIGYGTGVHHGQYVIEWIISHLNNGELTFPTGSNGKYKIWMTVDGERPRHEYRNHGDLITWKSQRPRQRNPDQSMWPTHVVRLDPPVISSNNNKKISLESNKRGSKNEVKGNFYKLEEITDENTKLNRLKEIAGHIFKLKGNELKERVKKLADGNIGYKETWRVAILSGLESA